MRVVNVESVAHVAEKLQALDEHFAFLGGAVLPLLLDDTSIVIVRPTKDVDVIVEVLTRLEYSKLEERLRASGFKHDMTQGAPKCRWVVDGIMVDIMAASGEASDWPSKWFPEALAHALPIELSASCTANVVTAPFFIATKLEAFFERGERDYYGSHDLEDILTVLDGRVAVLGELAQSPDALLHYLADQFSALLSEPDFTQCLPGHIPPDSASQERVPILLETIHQITQMQEGKR